MTTDQDVYRKTGRGGAGNYAVQSKADEADKVSPQHYNINLYS